MTTHTASETESGEFAWGEVTGIAALASVAVVALFDTVGVAAFVIPFVAAAAVAFLVRQRGAEKALVNGGLTVGATFLFLPLALVFVLVVVSFAETLLGDMTGDRRPVLEASVAAEIARRQGGRPMSGEAPRVHATVRWFSDEEAWGVADALEAPGGIFVHAMMIVSAPSEYRTLHEGESIEVELEGPLDFDQDGCRFRATRIWRKRADD